MMLTQLADVARAAGLRTIEVPGWRTRGHGPMSGVRTITCHHTANGGAAGNAPSLGVVRDGRPGLAGPLAHSLVARDGTVYIVAAGKCFHAGESRLPEYTNEWAIGIEAEAVGVPGTPGDWPETQLIAYARWAAALRGEFGLSVRDVRGHKETCAPPGRKADPDFNMLSFRSRVAAIDLSHTTPAEDNMPLTNADADLVAARLLATKVTLTPAEAAAMSTPQTPRHAGDELSLAYIWQWGGPGLFRALARIEHLEAQVADLKGGPTHPAAE